MPERPLISVILPAHNPGTEVVDAVDSILHQTERRLELILVDDGSDIPLAERVNSHQSDRRLRVVRQPHAGLAAALNRGMAEAQGTYIARMDADDRCSPHRLQRQLERLQGRGRLDLVSCLVEHGRGRERDDGIVHYLEWVNSLLDGEQISRHRFVESPVVHPSVLFHRRLIVEHGGYRDFDGPEDYDLWLRWLESGVRFGKVPEVLYQWNDKPTRLTHRDPRYRPEAFYRCKTPYLARWLARHNPHHPDVWIWGAGRITRRRARLLQDHGASIRGYIDIDPRKVGNQLVEGRVIHPEELPAPGRRFILSYVGSRGARAAIQAALQARNYREARDYLFAA